MTKSRIRELLEQSNNLTDELKYYLNEEIGVTPLTLDIIDKAICSLETNETEIFFSAIKNTGDTQKICDRIYEVLVYFYLKQHGVEVRYGIKICNKTPDLTFKTNGAEYLADVFVVNSPSKTITEEPCIFMGTETVLTVSVETSKPGFSRAKKIADIINEKAKKYSETGKPLVLFVFPRDKNAFGLQTFESAMYGVKVSEFGQNDLYPDSFNFDCRQGRAVLSPENKPQNTNLSALIAIDIFDILNRTEPGKRFQCLTLHHIAPDCRLPTEFVGGFSEISWTEHADKTSWKPVLNGDPTLVGKIADNFNFYFGSYSSEHPF